MSSCFRNESLPSRRSSAVLVLALVLALRASATASAQDVPTDGLPFNSVVDSSAYVGNTPLRIGYRTRGYGEETAETALGTHWATPTDGGLAFADGQFRIGNSDTDFSVNFGAGFRWRNDDYFFDSPRIFGLSFWYDGEDTQLDNYFNQLGVSFERLGPLVDLRLNANIPLEDRKLGDDVTFTGDTIFSGNAIAQGTLVDTDVSLRVVDFEVAPRLFNLNAWGYGGGYQMDGDGVSDFGYKAGVRGYIYNDLVLDVGVTDDDTFGTNTVVQVIWTPGRTSPDITNWTHNIDDRMRDQVYRNAYVAVDRTQTAGAVNLTDALGQEIRVVHVASDAAPGGDGTIENPLNNLDEIDNNSQTGDIVLAHSTSVFTGQSATIQDAQRFLGEGDNQVHTVVTSELGTINIPESSPGASALAKPIIQNASGLGAVVLMPSAVNTGLTPAEIEVSNFQIDGGARGVYSPNGVGDVNVNRMMIANTTGDGIELSALDETIANAATRSRFTPTITDVMFDNIGGDDIDLDATSTETTISEAIAISDITSTNGDGVGIRLTETKRAATIADFNWNGGTTGEGALRIQNTVTTGTVAMSGVNTITGGVTGVAGEGYAIRLEGGAATHTIGGTTITNTGGDSIIASGGTAGMNFTGRIEQTANNASLLSVENGHDGNLTFTELTAGAGVMRATRGDGLQFNNADGVYTFNDNVDIEGIAGGGATSAVNVQGDSTGVITLTDATFDNINGDTITFVGGTANMTLTGRINQTLNAFSVVDVSGGHDGTLVFNEATAAAGVINATTGDGLQFNNADGAYTFNDAVDLVGTAAGINVTNGSSGTFAFTDTGNNITNPTGIAINVENSDSIFTYAGDVDVNNTSGRPVRIAGNSGGSVTISATVDSTDDGILVENNTGGAVLFSGQVTLATATQDGVTIQNNTAGSTRFNALDITTTAGIGFNATNNPTPYTVEVVGTGNTIATTTGVGLNLNNVNVGTNGVNFASVSVSGGGTNGVVLTNVTGGAVIIGAPGTNPGDGGTISSTGAAVLITNAANVSLNNMSLTSTANRGVDYNVTNAAASLLALDNNNINTANGNAVNLNIAAAGTSSIVTLTDNDIVVTGSGVGINTANAAPVANLTLSGSANTVSTTTGVGLNLVNHNIANTGLSFTRVSTSNGATNGIVATNLTGGALTVGAAGTNPGDGGTITSTGDAVLITNSANVSINNMALSSSAGNGVDYNVTTAAASRLTLNGNSITGTALEGVDLDVSAAGTLANISIIGNIINNTNSQEALLLNTSGGTVKTVNLLVRDNLDISTNTAAAPAANLVAGGNVTLNATVQNNIFNSAATGQPFRIESASAQSRVRLNLTGNTASEGTAADDFFLVETAGNFSVEDLAAVAAETENTGGVDFSPNQAAFTNDPGGIPTP